VPDAKQNVSAAQTNDPNIVWRIGTPDNSNDEFSTGSAPSLVFDVGKTAAADWKQKQDAADNNPAVYKIRFNLDQVPAAPVFALDCFFYTVAPPLCWSTSMASAAASGCGRWRREPRRTPGQHHYVFARHGAPPLPAPRCGRAAMRSRFRSSATTASSTSTRCGWSAARRRRRFSRLRRADHLLQAVGCAAQEVTDVVLQYVQPLAAGKLSLKVGAATVSANVDAGGNDFGERVVRLEVPAWMRRRRMNWN